MKSTATKLTSVVLAASMALSFAACSSHGKSGGSGDDREASHSGEKISASTPWFNSKITTFKPDIDDSKPLEYCYSNLSGVDDDYLVVQTNGYYKMPNGNDIDWENFNYNEYSINQISVLDRKTYETVNTIDLTEGLTTNSYVDTVTYRDGKLSAYITTYDDVTYNTSTKVKELDLLSGKVLDEYEADNSGNEGYIERSFNVEDYVIETEVNWDNDDNAFYALYVTAPDGSKERIELKENGMNYYDIRVILSIGEGKALIPISTDKTEVYYELDLKTNKATKIDGADYSWLELDTLISTFSGKDGYTYYSTPIGISRIDMKKKTSEAVMNYSWCTVNRATLNYLSIVDCTEDEIVLCGEKYASSPYDSNYQTEFVIVDLTKAESNPHAGKTILEMFCSYGYVEEKIGDAIIKYNENSSSYFIEVTDRYSHVDDLDYSNLNSEDDYANANLNVNAKMSNELAMDIMNGEGPDILMNASELGQLNDTNYLADLTPYIGTLDPDKYFTNIIDASLVDGKLFHLPVSYMIEGIQTDAKYAGASGIGFTPAEYEKFLNETLNGTDCVPYGQALYFTKVFNAQSDKFITNGKADFSAPEFAELAEYVKNNVQENSQSWDEMYNDDMYYSSTVAVGAAAAPVKGDTGNTSPAIYGPVYGISGYFMNMANIQGSGTAILGIPSTDGRGPMVSPYVSVAVSAQAQNVDACGEFVKLLLSEDVQKSLAMNDNFVLSREAFREGGQKAVEYYNGEGGEYMFGYDNETGLPKDNRLKFSEQNINELEKIIESCSCTNAADAAINLILVEEMPAYFIGQKSLEEVAKVAQDRAQKVLDERG